MISKLFGKSKDQHLWIWSIVVMIMFSIFARAITSGRPLYCVYKSEHHFLLWGESITKSSILQQDLVQLAQNDFSKLQYDFVMWPLFHYDPFKINLNYSWQKPLTINGDMRLFLCGSDDVGRDVFSACLYGLQNSLMFAMLGLLISFFVGVIPASIISFFHIFKTKFSIYSWGILILIFLLVNYYLAFFINYKYISPQHIGLGLFIIVSLLLLAYGIRQRPPLRYVEVDNGLLFIMIVMQSIPTLMLFIAMSQMMPQANVYMMSCLIGIIYAPILIKYVRYYTWTASQHNFIGSQHAMGYHSMKIYWSTVLPIVMRSMASIFAFAICNMILLEAALRFLGIGLSVSDISLGSMLHQARNHNAAWWLVVFPGIMIYWITSSFYKLGQHLSSTKESQRDQFFL